MPLSDRLAMLVVLLALAAGSIAECQGDLTVPNALNGPVRVLTGAR